MKKTKYTVIEDWTCRDGSFRATKKFTKPIKLRFQDYLMDTATNTLYRYCGWTDSSIYDLSNDPEYNGWNKQMEVS